MYNVLIVTGLGILEKIATEEKPVFFVELKDIEQKIEYAEQGDRAVLTAEVNMPPHTEDVQHLKRKGWHKI